MDVVVGTYEELVLGYKVDFDDTNYTFSPFFSDHQHIGCVKTAVISDKGVLATGSTDEIIKLFNLVKNKELGSLMQHTGSVTDICFKDSHMFSSSEDGTLIVWRTSKWDPVRTLKGHKGAVYSIDVHPSGKMALSVGKDRTLRTWNLITGRCAFTTNIKSYPDKVVWSPDGTRYALLNKMEVDVYAVETGNVTMTIKQGTNLCAVLFIEESVLAVGGDEGKVNLHDLNTKEQLMTIDTETSRVKAMKLCRGDSDDSKFFVTASSDGFIKLWRLVLQQDTWTHKLLSKTNCNFRPTCLTIALHTDYKQNQTQEEVTVEEKEAEETKIQKQKKRSPGKKWKGKKDKTQETIPAKKMKTVADTVPNKKTKIGPIVKSTGSQETKKAKKFKNKKKKKVNTN